ncbi:hypothetical protein B0A49_04538 [Cryomyces minteri]|uniref:Uncharacterized protein n=1 Tax=Cryomyces minteri TaxID=331657 RepID=A0A4U0X610_9PEZI|nr:hypothetical protein B0A49_04538 [Cryomyces minteri]
MADCGPSNALQNFKQQTSADRSLHQDRLRSRQNPAQTFRSPGFNEGILDPEFEAFQAGLPSAPPEFQHFQQQQPHHLHPTSFNPSPGAPAWASDFQRLHISSPNLSVQQQSFRPQPQQQNASAWHQDFMRQQGTPPPPQLLHNPPQSMFSSFNMSGISGFSGYSVSSYAPGLSSIAQGKQRESETLEHFDDAAFEKAFDDAREEMMSEPKLTSGDVTDYQMQLLLLEQQNKARLRMARQETMSSEEQDGMLKANVTNQTLGEAQQRKQLMDDQESSSRHATDHLAAQAQLDAARAQGLNAVEHKFDLVASELYHPYEAAMDLPAEATPITAQAKNPSEANELAATAAQLLDSVADNTSQKFQESTFLALMRKLRDHEVVVQGDKMVEVSPTPLVSTTIHPAPTKSPLLPARLRSAGHLHTPPPEYITCKVFGMAAVTTTNPIPVTQQDQDIGRYQDGQAVVDLLNGPLHLDEGDAVMDSMSMSEEMRAMEESTMDMAPPPSHTITTPATWQMADAEPAHAADPPRGTRGANEARGARGFDVSGSASYVAGCFFRRDMEVAGMA